MIWRKYHVSSIACTILALAQVPGLVCGYFVSIFSFLFCGTCAVVCYLMERG